MYGYQITGYEFADDVYRKHAVLTDNASTLPAFATWDTGEIDANLTVVLATNLEIVHKGDLATELITLVSVCQVSCLFTIISLGLQIIKPGLRILYEIFFLMNFIYFMSDID